MYFSSFYPPTFSPATELLRLLTIHDELNIIPSLTSNVVVSMYVKVINGVNPKVVLWRNTEGNLATEN